ncbi:MAG: ribosome maturation factor RimP [Peptococcaceae bacterium]|nr:ribosome maturation factor RimP [Peptococcaceae bacterium]
MANNSVAAVVENLSVPVVEELGLELVDVEYVKEGGRRILRVYIDKPGGVSHEDCEAVSKRLDALLDEEDPIPQSYYLEVSSPGLERPLKKPGDFQRFNGRMIRVTTFAALEGRKKFTGRLAGVEEGSLVLEEEGNRVSIPLNQVASARLHVEF